MRTYLYKLTSDRGGAPCAPPARVGEAPLLTLSICKPAIRRTARVGDRLLGITSRALAEREGYPACAVIYAARVTGAMDFGSYYAPEGGHAHRPDCVYALDAETGELVHAGRSRLHAEPGYRERDLGRAPLFRNARTLLCADFRFSDGKRWPLPRGGFRCCGRWPRHSGRGTGYLRRARRRAGSWTGCLDRFGGGLRGIRRRAWKKRHRDMHRVPGHKSDDVDPGCACGVRAVFQR